MLNSRMSIYLATVVLSLGFAVVAPAQNGGLDELSVVVPGVAPRPGATAGKYDFPDLVEADSVQPFGAQVTSMDVGSMSNFRRAFFVDERAFVLQLPGSGRYYLGILNTPSAFSGRCARRPEALSKKGGTYILSCGNKGAPVSKFYILEDSDQLDEITARLQQ